MPTDLSKLPVLGLITGVLLFVVIFFIPEPEGMSSTAWITTAVALLMASWWITEAIPIAATALIPIVLFPVLGIASISETTAPYANPLIFLFLGGFVIAIAMQTWNLHRRIALRIISVMGSKPTSILIGFMIASAFLSMWVSNTATALMMLPIALSVLTFLEKAGEQKAEIKNFEVVLILVIAYSCNIGGIGTLIGTPPNALLAGFLLESYDVEISFARWMLVGVPLVVVLLPRMYLTLTKLAFPLQLTELPGGSGVINQELDKIGNITKPEIRVAVVFGVTALLWMFRPLITSEIPALAGLSDAGIAITSAVALFLIPTGKKDGQRILKWDHLKALPWDILILFGGGLSLAMAISTSGLATWIGESVGALDTLPILLLIFVVILSIIFLTEITSNTATAAAFLPILASSAIGLGQNPMLFILPAALAASCAFMLPVATPPNAIVYGSGKITIPQMAKAGLLLNIFISVVLAMASYTLFAYVFGVEIDVLPDWVFQN